MRRWLQAFYVLLFLSALALVTLVIGDIVYAFESDEDGHQTHEHGFYGPIFDFAWVVFLPTFLLMLIAGIATLIVGKLRGNRAVARFGARALVYCVLAVAVAALSEALIS